MAASTLSTHPRPLSLLPRPSSNGPRKRIPTLVGPRRGLSPLGRGFLGEDVPTKVAGDPCFGSPSCWVGPRLSAAAAYSTVAPCLRCLMVDRQKGTATGRPQAKTSQPRQRPSPARLQSNLDCRLRATFKVAAPPPLGCPPPRQPSAPPARLRCLVFRPPRPCRAVACGVPPPPQSPTRTSSCRCGPPLRRGVACKTARRARGGHKDGRPPPWTPRSLQGCGLCRLTSVFPRAAFCASEHRLLPTCVLWN